MRAVFWGGGRCIVGLAIVAGVASPLAAADSVTITTAKDNSLFFTKDGSTSSGAGPEIYSGRSGLMSGQQIKRAVLMFDVASAVPADATITSVSLTLNLVAAGPFGDHTFTLHRLTSDWGEGTSDSAGGNGVPATPDDATWMHTFWPDEFWVTPGGDYDPAVHGSQLITQTLGFHTWDSTPEMVADVQLWLDSTATNYGWIIIGNEATIFSSRKFSSRETIDEELRPALAIEFEPPKRDCDADLTDDDEVNAADLAMLLGRWGPCPGCPSDLNGDEEVNAADLATLLGAWGPC